MNETDEPLRLLRTRGSWTLEMTRMVPIDRHVLRPERRRVSGTDSVVRHLKERCSAPLVREALDLIVGQDDGTDQAFSLENERWVQQSADAENDVPNASTLTTLTQVMSDLRAELTTLRALHEALRGRMAHLERYVTRAPAVEPAWPARPALRQATAPSLRPTAARQRSLTPAAEDALAHRATEVSAAPDAPAAPQPTKKALLAVPTYAEVVTCLKQLLGSDPELRQEKGRLPKDLTSFFVARVVDGSDQDVGAIVLDQAAGAELGGRLLGLPTGAFGEQAKGELSPDMLDAMNEITNNLGGFINRANLDVRVRVRPLERYDAAQCPGLEQGNAGVGCTTKTGGRLWITTI
jgi:hypothetical protein